MVSGGLRAVMRLRAGVVLFAVSWLPLPQAYISLTGLHGRPALLARGIGWGIETVLGILGILLAGAAAKAALKHVGWRHLPVTLWIMFRTGAVPVEESHGDAPTDRANMRPYQVGYADLPPGAASGRHNEDTTRNAGGIAQSTSRNSTSHGGWAMSRGPMELVMIEFPDAVPGERLAPELKRLLDAGVIRVVDLAFIERTSDGDVSTFELSEREGEAAYEALDIIPETIDGLISEADLAALSENVDPGSTAAVILFEHMWANQLRDMVAAADGTVVYGERIPEAIAEAVATT
jgi:hypothetical protein